MQPQNVPGDKIAQTDKGVAPLQPSPPNQSGKKTYKSLYGVPPWWKDPLEGVALLSAVFYAAVTYLMWHDSHRNFVIDERAWLSVQNTFPDEIKEGAPILTTVVVKNTGKTPAVNPITYDFNLVIPRAADQIKIDYSPVHLTGFSGMMSPNASIVAQVPRFRTETDKESFTKAQVDDLLSGRNYIAVYGTIRFADVFGGVHWINFCDWRSYYANANYAAGTCTAFNGTGDVEK